MLTRFYVPATAGQIVYQIGTHIRPDDQQPSEEDVWVTPYPVLAWRITTTEEIGKDDPAWKAAEKGEHVEPVLIEDPSETQDSVWYPLPDGTFLYPHDCVVANLTAAKQRVLEDAQRRWDAKHIRQIKDATP